MSKNSAKSPTKKEIIKDKIRTEVKESDEMAFESSRRAPREAGINRQKEKLKASIGEIPSNKAVAIVAPERETPGKRARA